METSSTDTEASVADEDNPSMIMALDEIYEPDLTRVLLRKRLIRKLIYYDTIMCTIEKDNLFTEMQTEADDYHHQHPSISRAVCFRHVLHHHKEVLKGEIDKFIKSLADPVTEQELSDDETEEDSEDEPPLQQPKYNTRFSARFDPSYYPPLLAHSITR